MSDNFNYNINNSSVNRDQFHSQKPQENFNTPYNSFPSERPTFTQANVPNQRPYNQNLLVNLRTQPPGYCPYPPQDIDSFPSTVPNYPAPAYHQQEQGTTFSNINYQRYPPSFTSSAPQYTQGGHQPCSIITPSFGSPPAGYPSPQNSSFGPPPANHSSQPTAINKKQAALRAFEDFDYDRNGRIDVDEYMILINNLTNARLSRDDALCVFSIIDTDGSGTISKDEFINFYLANY